LNDLYARLLPPPLQVETLTLEDHGLTLTETWPRHPLHQCGNNRILSRGGALRPFWQKVAKTVGSWFFPT